MLSPEHPCPECGGVLEFRSGPGRFRRYRGEDGYEVPAFFVAPTCRQCERLWLDSAMVNELGRAFEQERLTRLERRQGFSRPVEYVTNYRQEFLALSKDPSANTITTSIHVTTASIAMLWKWLRPVLPLDEAGLAKSASVPVEYYRGATFLEALGAANETKPSFNLATARALPA